MPNTNPFALEPSFTSEGYKTLQENVTNSAKKPNSRVQAQVQAAPMPVSWFENEKQKGLEFLRILIHPFREV